MTFITFLKISFVSVITLFYFPERNSKDYTLLVFEGSDWCVNCIRLEKNILQSSAFQKYAAENKITVKRVDFPQRKKLEPQVVKENSQLAEQFRFTGEFPTLLLIADNGKKNIRLSNAFNEDPVQFINQIETKIQVFE